VSADVTAQIQRALAAEFERRGWEYDLNTGRRIAEVIAKTGQVDAPSLARTVGLRSMARTPPDRSDVESAIEQAVRSLDLTTSAKVSGMRILFVAAGPQDEARLRLDAEHREIRSRIRSSTKRDDVMIETVLAARPTDLIDELNRNKPTIVHFAGHGGPVGIALEDESGNATSVSTDQFVRLISTAGHTIKLVVLNSCDSAHQAEPLIAHVDAAVGTSRSVGDDAARTFSAQFYSSLAEGVDLFRAFEQARLQISLAGITEDDTPKLFVRPGLKPSTIAYVSA
jgi:hypothetical protein